MAFGVQIMTQAGMRNISDIRSARIIELRSVTLTSGNTVTAPAGLTSSNGFVFCTLGDCKLTFSGSTVTCQFLLSTGTQTFLIYFMRYG